MKIGTIHYDLWREELDNYFIANTDPGGESIDYKLYSVVNGVETLITEDTLVPLATASISFTDEGIYSLVIIHPTSTEKWVDPTPISEFLSSSTFSLKYFPITKQNVIDLIKKGICDCGTLDANCSGDTVDPVKSSNHNTQLLLSSQGLYLHSLLSQSFIRDYRSCFDVTMTDDSARLQSLLTSYYTDITLNGNNSSRSHLARLYLAYVYLLLYVIELDTAGYTTESSMSSIELAEIALVETMFDISTMTNCFNNLNINPTAVMEKLDTCYKSKPFGEDGICEELYYGVYWDVKSDSAWPTSGEIANGTKSTTDVVDDINIEPNTLIYQYVWFAVPVIASDKFLYWEEVGSAFNRSVIGAEGSSEFIIVKTDNIEVNGVMYYVYKYNWPSVFTNTLRLSVTV